MNSEYLGVAIYLIYAWNTFVLEQYKKNIIKGLQTNT